jgi:hypothetical protein
MKRIALILLFIGLNSYGQFHFSVKGGLLFSNVKAGSDYDKEPDGKTSYLTGASVEYKYKKAAIDLELSFADEGYSSEVKLLENGQTRNYDAKTSINTINFFLTAKYYPTEKINLKVGPYLSSITNVDLKYSGSGQLSGRKNDISDSFQNTDFGLVFGAELYIYKGLFIEGKYILGLKDIYKDGETQFTEFDPIVNSFKLDYSIKIRSINIGLGYKL